jgi:3-deoxy-D-manno-octulosonic-acid transferase
MREAGTKLRVCFAGENYNTALARRKSLMAARLPPMYFLYRVLTALSMLALAPYYALRGWRHGETRALRERFGALPPEIAARVNAQAAAGSATDGAIWIHAVSVGEVLAAKPLAEGLKRRTPDRPVYVSTTTETGQRLARERMKCADSIFYFPLDWVAPVRRVLRLMRPAMIVVMETEIWPNFLREAKKLGIPVVFANARISERSFARYNRWKFLTMEFFTEVLRNASLFLAQTPEDANRLRQMGAPAERVEVIGNLKYDSEPPPLSPFAEWLSAQIGEQERWPILVAGSVVAEEEEVVLAAYDMVQRRWRHTLLVLAPRKPERFDAAADIVEAGGWHLVRRSGIDLGAKLDEEADVILLDSIGELAGLYALADAVFVGGSIVRAGGHNILEPAWFGRPPVFGQSMENFREMAEQFLRGRAAVQVNSGPHLGTVWTQLIEETPLREQMGKAARKLWERNRGATERSLERITRVLASKGK